MDKKICYFNLNTKKRKHKQTKKSSDKNSNKTDDDIDNGNEKRNNRVKRGKMDRA